MPPTVSRRAFLLGSGAAALLAACGDDDATTPTTAAPGTSNTDGGGDAIVLGAAFDRNGLLVAGIEQRAPMLLFEQSGGLLPFDESPAELVFDVGGRPVTVARFGGDVDRAYYPLVTTFDAPGILPITTEVAGTALEFEVNVNERGAVPVAQVGDPMPSATTPTTADPLDVQTICTADPPCPWHDVSLDAALTEGRPVALLISTPAYCQVGICGPVLDVLTSAAPSAPDVAVIHLEVYPNGDPSDPDALSPLVTDPFQLTYEPVLFVANAAGVVTARLDNIYDSAELDAALRTVRA
jgi:hypothetical protein